MADLYVLCEGFQEFVIQEATGLELFRNVLLD